MSQINKLFINSETHYTNTYPWKTKVQNQGLLRVDSSCRERYRTVYLSVSQLFDLALYRLWNFNEDTRL